jgi:hypothetical protein
MADLENQTEMLVEALEEMRKQGSLSAMTLGKLNKALGSTGSAAEKAGDQVETFGEKFDKTGKKIVGVFADIASAGNAIRDNREDFRSLNPAIKLTGAAMNGLGKAAGGAMESVGELATVFAPGYWKALGVIVSGVGTAIKTSAGVAADAFVKWGEFSTEELQKAVESYRMLGNVGALSANGISGMMDSAIEAGMSLKQYSEIVAKNGQSIAYATGSTEKGAAAIAGIAKDFREQGFTNDLRKLGYTLTEQSEFTAKFMERNRLTGTIQMGDTKRLSEASKEYLEQLDQLSRLTGKSKDAIQQDLDAQLRNVRFQASLRKARARGDEDVAKAYENISAVIGTVGSKELAEGFQDAIGGLGTQAARDFFQATGGESERIIDDLRNKRITQEEALFQIQDAIKRKYERLGGDDFAERVGKMGTIMDPMLLGMQRMVTAQNLSVDAQTDVKKTQKDLEKTTDANTISVIKAQDAMQKMAMQLDKIVREKVFPNAADSVMEYTSLLEKAIDKLADSAGIQRTTRRRDTSNQQQNGPSSGPGPGGPGQPGTSSDPNGLRGAAAKNLNPGNLRFIGQAGATMGTSGFARFNTIDEGMVALANDLLAKLSGRSSRGQLDTLRTLIGVYAPPNENDTGAYIAKLAQFIGVDPDAKLTRDPKTLAKLMTAIVGVENYGDPNKGYNFRGSVQTAVAQALQVDPSEIGKFKYGGISAGPSSGYLSMMHGTEAVIPLPSGQNIPVSMMGKEDSANEQTGIMVDQVSKLDELVALMRINNATAERILRSSHS